MLRFILGTMTGGVMGVFAMCLFIAGKREDEALERCRMKRKEIIDHGVCICFVNSQEISMADRLHIICTTLDGLSKIKENE